MTKKERTGKRPPPGRERGQVPGRSKQQDAVACYNRGVALAELGRDQQALEAFDAVINLDPELALAWDNKGVALVKLGRHQEALEAYDVALKLDPNYAHAWYNKSCVLGNLRRHQEMIQACDAALKLDPKCAEAWSNRGAALDNLGRHEEAIEAYDAALKLDAGLAQVWYNKGTALSPLGRHQEALDAYDAALKLDPNDAPTWSYRGAALGNLGRHEEALEAYDAALEIDPNLVQAWNNKGVTLGELGRHQEALEAYDAALNIDPNLAQAWYGKGCTLLATRQYEAASRSFAQAGCMYGQKGETQYAQGALQQQHLAGNGAELMHALAPLDREFISSLNSDTLADLNRQAASCVEGIDRVATAFEGKSIPNEARALLKSKQICFRALSDALEFKRLNIEEVHRAKAIFEKQCLVRFAFALEDIRAMDRKLQSYRPLPLEQIPEDEQRALLRSLSGILILDGALSERITDTIRAEPRPAETSGPEKQVEIRLVHIDDTQKDWVRVCVVQLHFEVTETFPPRLTEACKPRAKEKVFDSLRAARQENVDIILFAELSFAKEWVEEIEREYKEVMVVCGSYYDENKRNACQIVVDGARCEYAKCHRSPLEDRGEGLSMTRGTAIPVLQTRFGKVLVAVCSDFDKERHRICQEDPDFVISPRWDPDKEHSFQQWASMSVEGKSDTSRSPTYTLFANAAKVEAGSRPGGGGSCIIGSDSDLCIGVYRKNRLRPEDAVKYKLFEADGEMMLIADLKLGAATGPRTKIGKRFKHDGNSWKELPANYTPTWQSDEKA